MVIPRIPRILQGGAQKTRYWEVDYARGMAVVMMVIFHLAFDLSYFGVLDINVYGGPWRLLAIATASLFLFIVGVSLSISGSRAKKKLSGTGFIVKYLKRGFFIFSLGMVITAVTWRLVPQGIIFFGILHLIGVSVMLAPFFLRLTWGNLAAGICIIGAGLFLEGGHGPLWLIWAGLYPAGFSSLDYTPMIPWFGLVLLGIFSGKMLYPGGERQSSQTFSPLPLEPGMSFLGRHSLTIYLLHQPVILLIIMLIRFPEGLAFS